MKKYTKIFLIIAIILFVGYGALCSFFGMKEFLLPLSWKGSYAIGAVLFLIYQFGLEDPIWKSKKC